MYDPNHKDFKCFLYSMKTGELRIREGYVDSYGFFIYDDDKGHHHNKFTWFSKDKGIEVLYSMNRNDKVMINQFIENRRNYINGLKERIENIEKEIEYLENIKLPLQ